MLYPQTALESCAKASEATNALTPLNYREIEWLVEVMLDLRDGASLPMGIGRLGDFRPSSDKASLEIQGTIAQRLEECRNCFEPKSRISVVERVVALEQAERQCPELECQAARSSAPQNEKKIKNERLALGRHVARLRESQPFRRSMVLLAFTLAAAVDEDWRMKQILNPYYRGW